MCIKFVIVINRLGGVLILVFFRKHSYLGCGADEREWDCVSSRGYSNALSISNIESCLDLGSLDDINANSVSCTLFVDTRFDNHLSFTIQLFEFLNN